MTAYRLVTRPGEDPPWQDLVDAPEAGPGYQFVEVSGPMRKAAIPPGTYVVFNAEFFVEFDGTVQDIARIQSLGATSFEEWMEAFQYEERTMLAGASVTPPPPRSPPAPVTPRAFPPWFPPLPGGVPALRGTFVVPSMTARTDVFWRVSAYRHDHRIDPRDRSLTANTYVTSGAEIDELTSGLHAVGRYALPNPVPACFAYEVRPEPGMPLLAGTVRPANGHAGGGAEVLLPNGSGAWSVTVSPRVLPVW